MSLVGLRNIRVRHAAAEILAVDALDALEGEVLTVMGPNGAGKSTLLRVLGLLEAPTEGEVRFRDRPVTPARALTERRRMAMVFQQPALADMTVSANVELGLRFRGVARDERTSRARRWLERLGIGGFGDRSVRTLSGGEAQRVAVARAVAPEPGLLLADEPSGNLDGAAASQLHSLLSSLAHDRHQTVVLVTHNDRLAGMADRVLRLEDGRLNPA